MQPLSYLTQNGILNFDANAYLNSPTPAVGNGLPFSTDLNGAQINGQPKKDGFFSSNANTIKKVAAGAIIAALAVVGLSKCKTGVSTLTNAVKKLFK